jgi:16S rRNA processing protein RimM
LFVQRNGRPDRMTVKTVRFQHERPVIAIEGVETITDAEALAGLELRVPVETLAALPPGTYYHHDLVGCAVETIGGAPIGTVTAVEESGGPSRLVVNGAHGEVLIPLAVDICRAIDVGAKRIVVALPEGLLELNAPTQS